MPSQILAHLTWTTLERRPVIDVACAAFLELFLPEAARQQGATVVAVGMVRDHVHLLMWLPPLIDVPRLVQALKGASSRIAARDGIVKGERLRWASGYDLRSVSPQRLPQAMKYIERQATHHPLMAMKSHSGAAIKPDSGAAIKPDSGAAIKPDSGAAIKPDSGAEGLEAPP